METKLFASTIAAMTSYNKEEISRYQPWQYLTEVVGVTNKSFSFKIALKSIIKFIDKEFRTSVRPAYISVIDLL